MKADNLVVTKSFLDDRYERAKKAGFTEKAKWIEFCEYFLFEEFYITLYEAKETYSKYITLKKNGKSFKVRFSNHKPIYYREIKKDCDFFVGVTNLSVTTTIDAIKAVEGYFNE